MKRRVILLLVWSGLLIAVFVVMGMAIRHHQQRKCGAVKITINHPDGDFFISENEIRDYMSLVADSVEGERLGKINIHSLEQLISGNPYVQKTAVYAGLDGVVHIDVVQRKPIVRVQNAAHEQWYISEDGRMMPVNPGKPAKVLFASGYITEIFAPELNLLMNEIKTKKDSLLSGTTLYKIFTIASAIDDDPFLKAQIEQLYLNKQGEFEMVPMVGKHLIIFGEGDAVKEKFENLKVFYRLGLSKEGWDKYDTINLKFQHQVVCTIK